MRYPCLFLMIAIAVLLAPFARAGQLVDLAVIDRDTGQLLPTYASDGALYVAGTPGHRYAVRLANRSGGRVLAVLSVDGVNAVTGQTASPDQSGYVLGPWETTQITGWRKSLDEVAQFNFTALPDSYAARTGRPDDVGVIGVAVFAERIRRQPPMLQKSVPAPAPPAAARESGAMAQSVERLGTGHGERESAPVTETRFERASRGPVEVLAIRYDSRRNLVLAGVIAAEHTPRPFPGGFVPDPPR